MSKLLIMPSSIKQANEVGSDGVIIGIKKLSINMPNYFEVEDIEKIKDKEIFISLNKNMHNEDLKYLEEVLMKLKNYPIKGVTFYDLAIINFKQRLDLPYSLVWHQEHMTNNYYTVNFMFEQGIEYSYISSDITLREMLEIKENSKAKLMTNVFGYIPMFASRRHLVDNYLETFNLESNKQNLTMEKEGKSYPIIDNENGTIVYTDFILDGLKESLKLGYEYLVLDSFKIDDEVFIKVVDLFKNVNENNLEASEKQLHQMFSNLKKGFFYEDTVYKVK